MLIFLLVVLSITGNSNSRNGNLIRSWKKSKGCRHDFKSWMAANKLSFM